MLPHPLSPPPLPPWELLANWHVKSRETRYVRPSQSMVVLQLLVWLCTPMREWQSLQHMGEMRLKEGKVELFLRRTRFSSAFWWRFTFAFSFLLSLSVSSEHDQSQIFPVVWIKMLWGHVSKRLWTAGRRTRLSRLLLLIVFIKLSWGCAHHPCDEQVPAISGGADWGGSACWGNQHVTVSHCWGCGIATWCRRCAEA